jgi:hypothetical protein
LTAVVLSGVVVMVLYRTRPRAASRLVVQMLFTSFSRVEDATGRIALLAIVAGLLSLAVGLPNRHGEESSTTVLDDLLAAQVACLVAALSIAFVAESIRCAADIVDDQSLLLAWPWALIRQSRTQFIADLLPSSARWWAAFGPLPVIAAIWAVEAWRHGGLKHMRKFVADNVG